MDEGSEVDGRSLARSGRTSVHVSLPPCGISSRLNPYSYTWNLKAFNQYYNIAIALLRDCSERMTEEINACT
jgi:hypothetical protein